ncbi:FadR/GntR family transcriptional regulator [Salinicola aestuarinus]|uniref:FadR/GntR family transcriptional regulator n=1 Tax=Salinicola aestuarinus TaxID=1949082 RepID=UPI000DA229E3|nr:FadR/GntR family transcriptional regulator [Salinicola aestuarinus]
MDQEPAPLDTALLSSDFAFQRISPQESLSRQIARQLESVIAEGRIAIHEKLPTETRLCDLFGVSRTVVREAIALLRSQGLVETQRGIGTRVVRFTPRERQHHQIRATTAAEILMVLELRSSLEPRAAALAAERRTPADIEALRSANHAFRRASETGRQAREEDYRFHNAVIEATHNPCFLAIYEPLNEGAIPRAKLLKGEMDLIAVGDYLERIAQEHEAVLEAIEAQRPEVAFAAMRRHFDRPHAMYSALAAEADATTSNASRSDGASATQAWSTLGR